MIRRHIVEGERTSPASARSFNAHLQIDAGMTVAESHDIAVEARRRVMQRHRVLNVMCGSVAGELSRQLQRMPLIAGRQRLPGRDGGPERTVVPLIGTDPETTRLRTAPSPAASVF